jgi:hypothetical protein
LWFFLYQSMENLSRFALLQLWEHSSKEGSMPDGCTLHINDENRQDFIENVFKRRTRKTPKRYIRPIGSYIDVELTNDIYKILIDKGSIKIKQFEFRNLIDLKDIVIYE